LPRAPLPVIAVLRYTLELLIRALLAIGASRKDVASALARRVA
jgi:hypothetical protein